MSRVPIVAGLVLTLLLVVAFLSVRAREPARKRSEARLQFFVERL